MSTKDSGQITWPRVVYEISHGLFILSIILIIVIACNYEDAIKAWKTEYYPADCATSVTAPKNLPENAK